MGTFRFVDVFIAVSAFLFRSCQLWSCRLALGCISSSSRFIHWVGSTLTPAFRWLFPWAGCHSLVSHFWSRTLCFWLRIRPPSSSSQRSPPPALHSIWCCWLMFFQFNKGDPGFFWSASTSSLQFISIWPAEKWSWDRIAGIPPLRFYAAPNSLPQCIQLWASPSFQDFSWFSCQTGCFHFQQPWSFPQWLLAWLPTLLQFPSSSCHVLSASFPQYPHISAQVLGFPYWLPSASPNAVSNAFIDLFPSADAHCWFYPVRISGFDFGSQDHCTYFQDPAVTKNHVSPSWADPKVPSTVLSSSQWYPFGSDQEFTQDDEQHFP